MKNKYAVIDVGTNNILFLIASLSKNKLNILHRDSNISALGKNMKNRFLTESAITRTKVILKKDINYAKLFTDNVIVVGTSCSREAKNIDILKNWLKKKFDLNYNIISGEQEAYFNGLANLREFNKFENILMFDVGGGSTEFTFLKNGSIISNQSVNLGIRRLENSYRNNYEGKIKSTRKILKTLNPPGFNNFILVGIGGTVTSLSSVKYRLQKYDGNIIHKSQLTNTELKNMLNRFRKMTNEEIAELMPFDPYRADIITTGTMIVSEILDFFSAEKFYVSDRGIQFGILYQNKKELQKMLS